MALWAPPEALNKCAAATTGPSETSRLESDPQREPERLAPNMVGATNSSLWNAMIAPIHRYAIRAVIWNQGESDAGESLMYFSCLFQALIESWRRAWRIGIQPYSSYHFFFLPHRKGDFAWVFVQLGAQDSSVWPTYWPFNGRLAQGY